MIQDSLSVTPDIGRPSPPPPLCLLSVEVPWIRDMECMCAFRMQTCRLELESTSCRAPHENASIPSDQPMQAVFLLLPMPMGQVPSPRPARPTGPRTPNTHATPAYPNTSHAPSRTQHTRHLIVDIAIGYSESARLGNEQDSLFQSRPASDPRVLETS